MARGQAAGRLRLLGDLGLSRRGRHPGVVRYLRPGSRDAGGAGARARAEQLGGRGRRRRGRTHQGRRLSDAHLLHGLRGLGDQARRPLPVGARDSSRFGVRAAAGADHRAVVTAFRHRSRFGALRRTRRPGVRGRCPGARLARRRRRRPLRGGAGARRRDRSHRGRPVRQQRFAGRFAAQDLSAAQGPRRAAPGGAADARGRQLDSAPQAGRQDLAANSIRSTPTSTTTCCGCRSGRNRCGTWSPPCSRPTCRCRTPG